jgi:hypothetical protein
LVSRRLATPFHFPAAWANTVNTFRAFIAGESPLNKAHGGPAGYLDAYQGPYAKAYIFADPDAEGDCQRHIYVHVDAIANQDADEDSDAHAVAHPYANPHSYLYTDFHPNTAAHARRHIA